MNDQLADAVRRASRAGGPCFTHFLDPAAGEQFLGMARKEGLLGGCEGGAVDAERRLYACWAEGCEPESWPVGTYLITWSPLAGNLGHRDILGAVLGLGISRDHIGDIRVRDTSAWLAAEETVGTYLEGNLSQAGRVSVSVSRAEAAPERERGSIRSVSVMSYRLDAVLAAALDISRAKAQEAVRSGRVQVGWREELRPDRELREGDVLSIRGKGRVYVCQTEGISRKGRFHIKIETFLGRHP